MTMACTHKRLKCTDNIFYCLDCGERIKPQKDKAKADPNPETPKNTRGKKAE